MRKSTFNAEQTRQTLRQVDVGTVAEKICRKLGMSEATFYRRKKTCAGLDLGEVRDSQGENRRLRQVVADLTLDTSLRSVLCVATRAR